MEPTVGTKTKLEHLCFNSQRQFGAEIEVNAFDGKARPENGGEVVGINYVTKLVNDNTREGSAQHKWEEVTANNQKWVVKPDSSCGMEICTPPLTGWRGVQSLCKVVQTLKNDPKISSDQRCSVHIHVDVADLTTDQIASILAWYVKAEMLFLDAMPQSRKLSRYCQCIGRSSAFTYNENYTASKLVEKIGSVKYYSMNAKAVLKAAARRTIEFRVVDGSGCQDPFLIKNWVRFLLHFVSRAVQHGMPENYQRNNPMSGLCWIDPIDFFKFMGFWDNPRAYTLSKGLIQTRNWFIARMLKYMSDTEISRSVAYRELNEILYAIKEEEDTNINLVEHLTPSDIQTALYELGYDF